MEAVHDFIQWMFPLMEASGVNAAAPVLDAETIAAFDSGEELRASFARMLKFYGLANVGGEVVRARNFAVRARDWIRPGNHNYLRITRILKSLRVLGLEEESRAFYECVRGIYEEDGEAVSVRTFQFWMATQVGSMLLGGVRPKCDPSV